MKMTDGFTGMDMVVSFDTTGSMYPVLSNVRQQVDSFVTRMFNEFDDIRIGIVAHGDYCDAGDPYTIKVLDLMDKSNKDKISDFIRNVEQTYGGDADECYELVLNNVRRTISWGGGRKKILVMIGDANPHSTTYPDNTSHIDWQNEVKLLNDMNVQIFGVHALAGWRSRSERFYRYISEKTGGTYLKLDQFNEVVDLIEATCISQYDEEKLDDFVSIIREKGRFTKTLAQNIGILSKKDYGYTVESVAAKGLKPVAPGRFQIMEVDENCDIKGFVIKNGIKFKRGRGFYELTKHETVQQYKEIIIQDRVTGEMFTGTQVRERLGLQPQIEKGGVKESLSSRDTAEFRVFVQSTSVNRKLIGGTTFLYEVSDLEVKDDTKLEIRDMGTEEVKSTKKEDKKATTKKSGTVEFDEPPKSPVKTHDSTKESHKKPAKTSTDGTKNSKKSCKKPSKAAKSSDKSSKGSKIAGKSTKPSKATKKTETTESETIANKQKLVAIKLKETLDSISQLGEALDGANMNEDILVTKILRHMITEFKHSKD